jgi:hypothetical protein
MVLLLELGGDIRFCGQKQTLIFFYNTKIFLQVMIYIITRGLKVDAITRNGAAAEIFCTRLQSF